MANKINSNTVPINAKSISFIFTILCSVFGAGFYCGNLIRELKDNDEVMKIRIELLDVKRECDGRVHRLREEIYQIKLENLKSNKDEK